jgi:2-keto-4-pentenoate hydratase/2-oxohepta-3-ene-1,7-dioic acid hydratase in catechol pathway
VSPLANGSAPAVVVARQGQHFVRIRPAIATGGQHDAIDCGRESTIAVAAALEQLIRDIPEIVRLVSAVMTLEPGDIIYTGTPGEPQGLKPGDVVEVEVTGVGILRNTVAG